MTPDTSYFETRLAVSEADLLGAQRLRYRVFVEELGADGPLVDHENHFERDEFDPLVDHLVLIDHRKSEANLEHVVGVYRLLPGARAEAFGRFYCDAEYDLSPLRNSGRPLLELGRSCIDAEYRGGPGMLLMWSALAEYVLKNGIELMFGVASFHGLDVQSLAQPLSWLHHNNLSPEDLRPRALASGYQSMDLLPADQLDRREAMKALPTLLKAYLRLGGSVGEGAFLDHEFNTTDVLLIVDMSSMSDKHRRFYEGRIPA